MQKRQFGVGLFTVVAAALGAAVVTPSNVHAGTFAPGTSEQTVEAIEAELIRYQRPRGSQRFNPGDRWPGTAGEPRAFTYSFAADGTNIGTEFDGTAGISVLYSVMDSQFGDDTEQWQDAISSAFSAWEDISGLRFTLVSDPGASDPGADDGAPFSTANAGTATRGDIRIGMKTFAGGAGGLCSVGLRDFGGADYGEIVLDANEDWTQLSSGELRFLFNCVAREIGVAVGLANACPRDGTKLMEEVLPPPTSFSGPQLDDIRAVHRLYGDGSANDSGGTFDQNDSFATAFQFDDARLQSGQQIILFNRSLDADTEEDYFSFTVPEGGAAVTVAINPTPALGGEYDSGPEVGGVCQPGSTVYPAAIQDLRIQLVTFDGVTETVLTTIDNNAIFDSDPPDGDFDAQNGEELSSFPLPAENGGEQFYIRISSNGGMDQDTVQLYSFLINLTFGTTPGERIIHMDEVLPEINLQAIANRPDVDGTGDDIVIANVEGGLPWLDHVSLDPTKVWNFTFNPDLLPGGGATPAVRNHATGVVGVMAGIPDTDVLDPMVETPRFRGVSSDLNIAASTIADGFTISGSFLRNDRALAWSLWGLTDQNYAVQTLGLPRAASVVNMSWGSPGDFTGDGFPAQTVDAVAARTGALMVAAAGNAGILDFTGDCQGSGDDEDPGGQFIGARTVGGPASAFNILSVGAVGTHWRRADSAGIILNPDFVANFSSKGPIDTFNYSLDEFDEVINVRSGIHLVAPGTGLVIPSVVGDPSEQCPYFGYWTGSQRLNLPWIDPMDFDINGNLLPAADTTFFSLGLAEEDDGLPGPPPDPGGVDGTSFAAPLVASVAGLLQDAALEQGKSINGLVLRAVLMTGARKAVGWSNVGLPTTVQMPRDGRDIMPEQIVGQQIADEDTTQALDIVQGAGILDTLGALQIYFGRLDIPDNATPQEEADIRANPTPEFFEIGIRDTPLTNPTKPTVTPVTQIIPPDPFPGAPAAATKAGKRIVRDEDKVTPTPLEVAKVLRAARSKVSDDGLGRYWIIEDDDPIIIPGSDGDGGDPGAPPITGVPPIPPQIDGDVPRPGDNIPGSPVILDGPIVAGRIGWDIAQLGIRNVPGEPPLGGLIGYIDYLVGPFYDIPISDFGVQEVLTATLVWDRNVKFKRPKIENANFNPFTEMTSMELEDLDLELHTDVATAVDPILASNGNFDNVEHIYFPLPQTGSPYFLRLRVNWAGQDFDLLNNNVNSNVRYALAWRTDTFDSFIDWRDSLNNADESQVEDDGSAPAPASMESLAALLFNIGSDEDDENFNASLDMNNDGVLDVRDVSKMIYAISANR